MNPGGEVQPAEASTETWPLVSVVIPVLNDAARLDRCLASLARQDYPAERVEVIVVDNGSQDGSSAVAQRHAARVLDFPGLKVGALRNRGVQQARGDILAFVDSDHELPSDWVRNGVSSLRASGGQAVVGAPCLAPSNGTWVQRIWQLHRLRNARCGETEWLGAGNMFLRRDVFHAAGGFREDLTAAEDVDLCARVKQRGGKVISDPRIANFHWGEPTTLAAFFRKEWWRGADGVRTFLAHGCPRHELPSLVFPLHHVAGGLLMLAAVGAACVTGNGWYPAACAAMLLLPSLFLSLNTSRACGQWRHAPALMALYLTYGFARAAALLHNRRHGQRG